MRLLRLGDEGEMNLLEFIGPGIPPYAVLSHTRGDGEVAFENMVQSTAHKKPGLWKLVFGARQAALDGLRYIWDVTCCIDRFNDFEVKQSLYILFELFQRCVKCHVFLTDVAIYN